jgi:hypothetical protein
MREAEQLAAAVRRVISGDPWYGRSARSVLGEIDAAMAHTRVPGTNHSIWELVLHMTAWANHVSARLAGGAPGQPAQGDFPLAKARDDAAWKAALIELQDAHDDLARAVAARPDASLEEVLPGTPLDGLAEPVTVFRLAVGVAEHSAYHVGQIALLEKLLAPPVR